jgi:hypothetical protein
MARLEGMAAGCLDVLEVSVGFGLIGSELS